MIVNKGDCGHGDSWRVKKRAYLNDKRAVVQASSDYSNNTAILLNRVVSSYAMGWTVGKPFDCRRTI
ncbi:hypothetical protein YL54_24585 [Salmonella enterica subsp. enterica serovar Typhimurium]|nr:hypothetical protein [Salmonella enterica subsp. enterica serovar Typhimurium]